MRKFHLRKGAIMENEVIAKDLLEILACPMCKSDIELVEYSPENFGLKCTSCKKIYPIKDGIPVMLIEEAIPS